METSLQRAAKALITLMEEDMIKVSFKALNGQDYHRVMAGLRECRDLDFKTAYNIKRISDKIQTEFREIQEASKKIFKDYVVYEESGLPKFVDNRLVFLEGKTEADFNKVMDVFLDNSFEIDKDPIPVYALERAKLSANDIGAIEFLLAFPEEVKDNIRVIK
jgi:hypothetical protein